MTFVAKPKVHHPRLPVNEIGLTRRDYEGSVSTLCAGCGHDSVSAAIVQGMRGIVAAAPSIRQGFRHWLFVKNAELLSEQVSWFSIPCTGRMPSVITGANLANRDLYCIGVSGDGDSASIGMGQFAHIMRRRIDMLYVVDNNGTYGLTKGQFSATNDKGSTSKKGVPNLYEPLDLVSMALQIGASFVARSFSGDKHQLVPLIKAGLRHRGMAFIDVISPCVAFNNHEGSTKSYDHTRVHSQNVVDADFIVDHEEITVDYRPGTVEDVTMPGGETLRLYKLDSRYDVHDRVGALNYVQRRKEEGEVVTGLLYVDPDASHCHEILDTVHRPLNELNEGDLCPGNEALQAINESFR